MEESSHTAIKMKIEKIEKSIEFPEGITATIEGRRISIQGEKGKVDRLWKNPKINATIENNKIILLAKKATNREKKDLFTLVAHIKNIITGVTEGHTYKLKICSGHFPMNVSISNNTISVKNFLGEKIPRVYAIKEGADVKIDGDIITIESCNKEIAGDVAACIERLTRITNRDRRIFQDGIYIIIKDGKELK